MASFAYMFHLRIEIQNVFPVRKNYIIYYIKYHFSDGLNVLTLFHRCIGYNLQC